MFRLGIVVINYKTADLVCDCLRSFEGEIDKSQDRIVVVDNASGDGSIDAIRSFVDQNNWGEWCIIIDAECNGGFSYGNNVGINAIDAQYYWLTNSDTLCRPGCVERMLEALEKNPKSGLIAPRLEWPDATPQISCFRYPSPWSELIDAAATGPITKLLCRWDVPIAVEDVASEPQWVSFASVLIRKETLEDIGLMDEEYFMYYEDVDYCRRAKSANWQITYVPEARVVHLRGGSSPVKKLTAERKRRPAYYYHSRARYLAKFYGRSGLWVANTAWQFGYVIARCREIVGHKRPHTCRRQWLDNWTNWLRPTATAPISTAPATTGGGKP